MTAPARFFCSDSSRERGEAVLGTASRIDRWLLVEAPGAWNELALPRARGLDDALLRDLQLRARAAHARTLLVRRPDRGADREATPGGRRVFVADSRPGRERLLATTVSDDDLATLALPYDGDAAGWEPAAALVGVCTQGAHDACCAVRGRPVVRALARTHPEVAWEVSHVGGDRFAPNLLVLPWGHYLGGVEPDEVGDVVAAVLAGRRPPGVYRGRSCWSTPVQAALTLAADELGITSLTALTPTRLAEAGPRRWTVTLGGAHEVVAEVEQQHDAPARLTCRAVDEVPAPSWRLVSLAAAL